MSDHTARTPQVLVSFTAVNDSTNPYVTQLLGALRSRMQVDLFTWPRAFAGRYDVIHLHWPERLVRGTSPWRSAVRALLLIALLTTLRVRRKAVVRTVHNERPHEPGNRLERLALGLVERTTALSILLNDASPPPPGRPAVVIPHGHYIDVVPSNDATEPVTGRILFFGLVRRYKGIDELLSAFAGLAGDVSLRVVGRVVDDDVARVVREAADRDRRITVRLEHVPESDLAYELAAAQLVALPYRRMANSGALLLALSCARPVLVPDNAVTRSLANEVGEGWVRRFPEPLTTSDLAEALEMSAAPRATRPNLSRRDWMDAAVAHERAYGEAITAVRGGRA